MGNIKPILFNTRMVQAILSGKKTSTRRPVKFPVNQYTGTMPDAANIRVHKNTMLSGSVGFTEEPGYYFELTPPYLTGDILYVRETFAPYCINTERCSNSKLGHPKYCYRATAKEDCVDGLRCKWIPSIHMPREAARIWMEVTHVKAVRLQEIKENQAAQEGCAGISEFRDVWQDTIPRDKQESCGWDANPWVWIIEFKRCGKPEEW